MQYDEHQINSKFHTLSCSCGGYSKAPTMGISRRGFLGGLAGTAALGGLMLPAESQARAVSAKPVSPGMEPPLGTALLIMPVLTYHI